jgi:hypothetical protein
MLKRLEDFERDVFRVGTSQRDQHTPSNAWNTSALFSFLQELAAQQRKLWAQEQTRIRRAGRVQIFARRMILVEDPVGVIGSCLAEIINDHQPQTRVLDRTLVLTGKMMAVEHHVTCRQLPRPLDSASRAAAIITHSHHAHSFSLKTSLNIFW